MSLSDNLKPWPIVLKRLALAAEAGFVIALYNPRSKARPTQLGDALDHLCGCLPASIPVAFARAIGRADESVRLTTLAEADATWADMSTLVLIGCEATHLIPRPNGAAWLYTSRRVEAI